MKPNDVAAIGATSEATCSFNAICIPCLFGKAVDSNGHSILRQEERRPDFVLKLANLKVKPAGLKVEEFWEKRTRGKKGLFCIANDHSSSASSQTKFTCPHIQDGRSATRTNKN